MFGRKSFLWLADPIKKLVSACATFYEDNLRQIYASRLQGTKKGSRKDSPLRLPYLHQNPTFSPNCRYRMPLLEIPLVEPARPVIFPELPLQSMQLFGFAKFG